jgi:hypothetical protein
LLQHTELMHVYGTAAPTPCAQLSPLCRLSRAVWPLMQQMRCPSLNQQLSKAAAVHGEGHSCWWLCKLPHADRRQAFLCRVTAECS